MTSHERPRVIFCRTVIAIALTVALAGCAAHPQFSQQGETAAMAAGDAGPSVAPEADERGGDVPITKVLVFVVENHSLKQMRQSMPRVFRFALRFAF